MGFVRTLSGLIAISAGLFYLTSASSLSNDGKWLLIGITFSFMLIWVLLGGRSSQVTQTFMLDKSSDAELQETEEDLQDDEVELEIPAPVTQESLDGVSLRERKLAKIKAIEDDQSKESDDDEETIELQALAEEVHKADEYVVEVSPESVEDADIEMAVSNRRIQHQEIRSRIEKRRRNQLAEIRASTVRMWEQYNEGEDIIALLQQPQHGLRILEEPEKPDSGHVYGATFIRINEDTVLKLRTPLDSGFEEVEKKPKLPELGGLPLPSLPVGDLSLPPLPSQNASDALAALKSQMDED